MLTAPPIFQFTVAALSVKWWSKLMVQFASVDCTRSHWSVSAGVGFLFRLLGSSSWSPDTAACGPWMELICGCIAGRCSWWEHLWYWHATGGEMASSERAWSIVCLVLAERIKERSARAEISVGWLVLCSKGGFFFFSLTEGTVFKICDLMRFFWKNKCSFLKWTCPVFKCSNGGFCTLFAHKGDYI